MLTVRDFAQIVGLASTPKIGPFALNGQDLYVSLTRPDLEQMTVDDIAEYYSAVGLGRVMKLGLSFAPILAQVWDELKGKYGDVLAYRITSFIPVTDSLDEARTSAGEVAQILTKIYAMAKEALQGLSPELRGEAMRNLDVCFQEIAYPFGDTQEQVNEIVQCTVESVGWVKTLFPRP